MRYFIDTEFIEEVGYLEPISIGIVCEDGREYSAVVADRSDERASAWVFWNVIAKLPPRELWKPKKLIASEIQHFIGLESKPEFWGFYPSYDWVCFCWLLGGKMIDLPTSWPWYLLDLKQVMHLRGLQKDFLPPKSKDAHNALVDARWNHELWKKLFPVREKISIEKTESERLYLVEFVVDKDDFEAVDTTEAAFEPRFEEKKAELIAKFGGRIYDGIVRLARDR